jgi:hypothetical protein
MLSASCEVSTANGLMEFTRMLCLAFATAAVLGFLSGHEATLSA